VVAGITNSAVGKSRGNLESIHEYVRLHDPAPLPDDSLVRGKNK